MENIDIAEIFELLTAKSNHDAYHALQVLQRVSEETNAVYPYMDRLSDMMDSQNSYVRTRGLILIASNAKWDVDCKIDELIDRYLTHITDKKPITARQCIKLLPVIAKSKPELREDITAALNKADITVFADSMRPLVYQDIRRSLEDIQDLINDD